MRNPIPNLTALKAELNVLLADDQPADMVEASLQG